MRRRGSLVSSLSRVVLGVMALAALGLWPAPARPDFPPEKFENLQVLPEDIEVRRLLDIMKAYSQALGVRCWFCHEGQEGQDLAEFNFVSDDKAHKLVAREMMKMVQLIREESLPAVERIQREVEGKSDVSLQVNCYTCHRGKAKPGD